MFDRVTINYAIDQIVNTIDSMFDEVDIPLPLKQLLYLACSGMILNYGLDYMEDIYSVFTGTKFIYGLENITSKLNYHELESLHSKLNPNNHAYTLSTINSHGNQLSIDYTLIVEDINNNPTKLLEFICHELNHILTSLKKTFQYREDGVYFRYGLFLSKVSFNLNNVEQGRTFNEVINTLQTEDIMKEIIGLKRFKINNPKFRDALSLIELDNKDTYKCSGYEPLVNLFRPLYGYGEYKKFINKNVLDGNIRAIEDDYDMVLGKDSYLTMNDKLDRLEKGYCVSRSCVGTIYDTATKYLYFRNRFIKGYLNSSDFKKVV